MILGNKLIVSYIISPQSGRPGVQAITNPLLQQLFSKTSIPLTSQVTSTNLSPNYHPDFLSELWKSSAATDP